jgi:regulator of sigma E protease
VATWNELRWELLRHALDRAPVTLETVDARGDIAVYRLDLARLDGDALESDIMPAIGLRLMRPELAPVLGDVLAGSPAAAAGLRVGDRIRAIDGKPIAAWHELAHEIRAAGARELVLEVERGGGTPLRVSVMPELVEEKGGRPVARIGIAVKDDPDLRGRMLVTVRYGAAEALQRAGSQTWETAVLSLRMMGRMLLGELSVRNISGPVTIADYAGQSARMGSDHYLRFLALISISLGVLNLLPIPVLDGGHLMYYFAEVIKGGPLSERVMEIGQQIGLALLALLMAVAFYNDINRLFFG